MCFDVDTLIDRHGWLAGVFAYAPRLISVSISVGTVGGVVLFGLVNGDQELRRLAGPVGQSRRVWLWVLGHLATLAGLAWLTQSIFERSALLSNPAVWVALWISTGLAMLTLWMLAVLPLPLWYRLIRSQWNALLFGIAASVIAVLVGQSTSSLWESFHLSTFWAVRGVLGLFCRDVVCRPDEFVVGTHGFLAGISPECSGFEGIGLIRVFLGAFYW
ncbi:MAG: hypothetical protein ACHRXM_18105 [Isosphaerales bacterium]